MKWRMLRRVEHPPSIPSRISYGTGATLFLEMGEQLLGMNKIISLPKRRFVARKVAGRSRGMVQHVLPLRTRLTSKDNFEVSLV